MRIKVSVDFSAVQSAMRDAQRQLPFATATALTRVAKDVAAEESAEVKRVFDRPVRYTERAFGVTPARKTNLTAVVFIYRKQAEYLQAQIEGGARRRRPFEAQFAKQLQGMGDIRSAVPGKAAKLNAAGNISKAEIQRLGRAVQAKRQGQTVVIPPRSGKAGGIFRRVGKSLEPVLIFSRKAAQYRKRFDFQGVGRKQVQARFDARFAEAWQRALATAR